MTSKGEKMLTDFTNARAALVKLTLDTYELSDVRDVLSTIGSKTELFLKSAVFPEENPRRTFEWFINRLANDNFPKAYRENLDDLRNAYNTAKHDPAKVSGLLEAMTIVQASQLAVEELVKTGIGSINQSITANLNRVFWVAVWDHYVHGDSEVHIILPAESSHWLGPPTFDVIYVKAREWDEIEKELSAETPFTRGRDIIPEKQFRMFQSDENFLGAWVYEGDYRSLIAVLARHELRQDLLPGLNRHDRAESMIVAFLLAGLDAAVTYSDAGELELAILHQASTVYAAPPDYELSQKVARGMVDMFLEIPFEKRSALRGPIWVGEDEYNSLAVEAKAKHLAFDIIIDREYTVRIRWRSE